jgi:hypothetical protein
VWDSALTSIRINDDRVSAGTSATGLEVFVESRATMMVPGGIRGLRLLGLHFQLSR